LATPDVDQEASSGIAMLAQKAPDRNDKVLWLLMAEAWTGLAHDAARLRNSIAQPDKISGEAA